MPLIKTPILLGLVLVLAGCATPVGVNRVGYSSAYAQVNANALHGAQVSHTTRETLHRCGLLTQFAKQPRAILPALHEHAATVRRRELLLALAEVSLLSARQIQANDFTGQRRAARPYYLAAAVYGWLYLYGDFHGPVPTAYDREFRLACDLYNHALAEGLRNHDGRTLTLESASYTLPVGKLTTTFTFADAGARGMEFTEFLPADDYAVRGLTKRNRTSGIGVPLIAVPAKLPAENPLARYAPKNLRIPGTVVLQVQGDLDNLQRGGLSAALEAYATYEPRQIQVGKQAVPLEADITAPLAAGLEGALIWKSAMHEFFTGREDIPMRLHVLGPYQPGKIPVVFVHGTAGAMTDWTEVFNVLSGDPAVRQRFQFWFFSYPSGVPILYSSAILRDSIRDVVQAVDPAGKDAALRQIVVVGHSQGALLTRLTGVSAGNRFWGNISDQPFDEIKLPAAERDLWRRCLFFEPSPYVSRLVFVCAPHRGSYRISGFVSRLAERSMRLPQNVVGAGAALLTGGPRKLPAQLRRGVPTSVSNMQPGSPFVHALGDCPFGDRIKLNSIIAVLPGLDVPGGNDGVVEYGSAHLPAAESEFIVRWEHGCIAQPQVVEEIRRILLRHLDSRELD